MANKISIVNLILIVLIIIPSIHSKPISEPSNLSSDLILYNEKVNSNTSSLTESHKIIFRQTESIDSDASPLTKNKLAITTTDSSKTLTSSVNTEVQFKSKSVIQNSATSVRDIQHQESPVVIQANKNDTDILLPIHGQSEHLERPEIYNTDDQSDSAPENISNERRLIPKVIETPMTEEDIKIRQIWGGQCDNRQWQLCSKIKTWGGVYFVDDKKNPGQRIEKYYSIKCFGEDSNLFCLRNGFTVSRCHLLCMSQCNNEYLQKYEKLVSHDGICTTKL